MAVETKLTDTDVDPSLRYFKARFPSVDAWQVALEGQQDRKTSEGIRLTPAARFLAKLV
jgi:hypothetical protein